ncbi:hypothetical protein Dimus_026013 [Dionaea muscipula]
MVPRDQPFSLVQRETENLQADIEKLRSELGSASLSYPEIHALRAQLEAEKYDVIKYYIGTLISISAVGLAAERILLVAVSHSNLMKHPGYYSSHYNWEWEPQEERVCFRTQLVLFSPPVQSDQ